MRSNAEFSPRLLVAVCWSVLAVLFSIPASAHPVYLTGEGYTWDYELMSNWDNQGQPSARLWEEVQPQISAEFGNVDDILGVRVTGSYESQQQSSDDAFSFSARSSVTAEGAMSSDYTTLYPQSYPGYWGRVSQKFYYLEFLVTEEVLFTGNFALTDATFPLSTFCGGHSSDCPEFGEVGNVFLSGSILGAGIYSFWSGSPSSVGAGFAFDGFASVGFPGTDIGGPGTASSSSFTQFIDMRFTAVAVPTPSTFLLTLSGLGLALFARSRRFWSDRGGMQLVSQS